MSDILYVYAVTREAVTPDAEAVDGSRHFGAASIDGVSAVFSRVESAAFSQDAIDRRATDLQWLGAIGYRHQAVNSALMLSTAVVPMRAFTLFSSEEALRSWLNENRSMLAGALDRLDGRREWTLKIEIDPERWSEALTGRVPSLAALQQEIEASSPGKAFLLRKKLEDEKKRASKSAENDLVAEVERTVSDKLRCETVAESREARDGAFPQIDLLIQRDEEAMLEDLRSALAARYGGEGVSFALTGPWPPYTFAGMTRDGSDA